MAMKSDNVDVRAKHGYWKVLLWYGEKYMNVLNFLNHKCQYESDAVRLIVHAL